MRGRPCRLPGCIGADELRERARKARHPAVVAALAASYHARDVTGLEAIPTTAEQTAAVVSEAIASMLEVLAAELERADDTPCFP